MKSDSLTILVVNIRHLDEGNFSNIAESIIEKLKTRKYRHVMLLVSKDIDRELLQQLIDLLHDFDVHVSIVTG